MEESQSVRPSCESQSVRDQVTFKGGFNIDELCS
jgi:hypothetical protein